jgi:hypothetical protein
MSVQAWLNSVGGVGYKRGDVDLANDLTGVQTYFDPARPIYWDVRKAGPIRGPDGKPIEEVSQVAAMSPEQIDGLLIRLIPPDIDPSTQLDRREPMRLKLKSAIDTLTKPEEERRRKSDGGISWADDTELADEDLDVSAEHIVRRSQTALRKQRQQKREDKQREVREASGPRDTSKGKGWAPRGDRATAEVRVTDIAPGTTHRLSFTVNDACTVSVPIVVWEATSSWGVLGQAFRAFARPLLTRPELSTEDFPAEDQRRQAHHSARTEDRHAEPEATRGHSKPTPRIAKHNLRVLHANCRAPLWGCALFSPIQRRNQPR